MKKLVGFMVVILVMMTASSPPKAHENNTNAVKDNINLVVPEESVVSFEASEINSWQISTQDKVLSGTKNSKLATGGAMIKICDVVNSDDLCNLFCRNNRERCPNFAIGGASERICDTHVSDLSKAGDIDEKLQPEGPYQRIWLISSAINSHAG